MELAAAALVEHDIADDKGLLIDEHKLPALRMPGGQLRIRTGELTKYL